MTYTNMHLIKFEITTPERTVSRDLARQVTLPTASGEITVLPGHIPLVAPVAAGEIRVIAEDGHEILMSVAGGFATVSGDRVIVLSDTAERAEELDLKAAEEAYARAEAAAREKAGDVERFADATAHLARELARLKVARKRRPGRRLDVASRKE